MFDKASALGESLIINHSFVDGNKRTGMLAMMSLLINEEYFFSASSNDLYVFVINISTGAISFDKIVEWLKENTTKSR